MRYLGLDLGSKTLGVSLSDPTGFIASSYKVIRHNEEYERLINEVKEIVEEKKVEKIVLGLPKNMNNSLGFAAERSLSFKTELEKRCSLPIHLVDERLSTMEAENILLSSDTSRNKRKKIIVVNQ